VAAHCAVASTLLGPKGEHLTVQEWTCIHGTAQRRDEHQSEQLPVENDRRTTGTARLRD